MLVNKDGKFYMNDIEMYSTHNEGKSDVTEWFRTLKNKIYKYVTSVSKNMYINELGVK